MRLKVALKSIGLLFLIYSFLRLVFFFLNLHSFQKVDSTLIFMSFINGLRFDACAILLLNAPFLGLLYFATKSFYKTKRFQHLLYFVFIFFNYPFLLANLIDTEYYKFTGNRMTVEVLAFQKEAQKQAGQFFLNYWHIVGLAVILLYALYKFFPRDTLRLEEGLSAPLYKQAIISFVVALAIFMGVRGGLQTKPLQPAHAYTSGSVEVGGLILNSTFTLLKSKVSQRLKSMHYFEPEVVMNELKQNSLSYNSPMKKQNVVLIILESFATEFWGAANDYKGYTPYLDSLAKEGMFYKNNFANGRRSIDAFHAILFGIPPFMSLPIIRSNYYSNNWVGIGDAVKKAGYHVSFFHGAKTGTMYFDAISGLAGFDDYYPLERYKGPNEFDGHWGIYDEPFLQFMLGELNKHPKPFFSTVFTISTHQPYSVPSKYEGKFPKGTLKIHESVGYVDNAVKKFFEEASKQPWYKDTLFIITGDHTQMSEAEHYNTTLGRFMVPLLLYHPSQKLVAKNPDRITQQTDLMPTILDYLGIHDQPFLLFGRSVFDETQEGESMFFSDNNYWLIHNKHYIRFSELENTSTLYKIEDVERRSPVMDNEPLRISLENRMKSYIQYYRNGLIKNDLYKWNTGANAPEKTAKTAIGDSK